MKLFFLLMITCMVSFLFSGTSKFVFENPNSIYSQIDRDIIRFFSSDKSVDYVWYKYPKLRHSGLTFYFSVNIKRVDEYYTSFDQVEQIYVRICTDLLQKMHSIQSVRPFLCEFPLTPELFSLVIGFKTINMDPVPSPYIAAVFIEDGVLTFYEYVDPKEKPLTPYRPIYKKPLAEIPAFQEMYKSAVLPSVKPSGLPVFDELECRQNCLATKADFEFAKKFAKNNELYLISLGRVSNDVFSQHLIQFTLGSNQRLDLEKARKLAASCAHQTLQFVRTNRDYINLMEQRLKDPHWKYTSKIPLPSQQAFRISFWDENVDRVPPGYIAEIRVQGESFKYYTSDEYQRVQLVHEESFDEAMKALDKE